MVQVAIDNAAIANFCEKWKVAELSLFGSVLRDDFRPESDIDVLVSLQPGVCHGLLELVDMQDELSEIFGRRVDLVQRAAVEQSENYLRRSEVLRTRQVIYASG